MLSTPSCNPGQPFVKLDPTGQASVLNYNLPSETCFETKGYIEIKINPECWSDFAKAIPDDNFWDNTRDYSASQVAELLNDDILGAAERPATINAQALQRLSLVIPSALHAESQHAGATSGTLQKQTLSAEGPEMLIAGIPASAVIAQVLKGRRPIIRPNFYGKPVMTFLPRPKAPKPHLTLVLHYKVCTFAGNYGAGKTLKTFSLLPGEETTISITTFRHNEEKKSRAESILDSFSQSSAQEFQQTIEEQSSFDETTGSASTNGSEIGGGINLTSVGVPIDVSGGVSNSATTSSSITEHMGTLNSALNTHSSLASNNRDVSVNTEVSSTSISEQTESTVRKLRNINLSRVLNFVFRQLLQEYITITYLDDVSIVFSNGYPESKRVVKLSNINDLLNQVLKSGSVGSPCADAIEKTRKGIFRQLCNIFDHTGTRTSFMECVTETLNDCCNGTEPPITNTYARKVRGLSQTAEGKTVPGIVLDVRKRILRTDSLVVDALLGQGEALDCYNQHLQSIAVNKAQLENDQLTQQMQIIAGIGDPMQQSTQYKKVFGPCCESPQSGCGCGCNQTEPLKP